MRRVAIDALIRADPFVPFAIVMTSGERYHVSHDWMAVAEDESITVYHPHSQRRDILRLNQLSSIEVLDPSTTAD
jgi:hypothetical protein